MSENTANRGRRRFIQFSMLGLAAVPLSHLLWQKRACAADSTLPKLEESDPQAQALGYVHDATKANVEKYPQAKGKAGVEQLCNNCQFYTDPSAPEWGPCALFPGKAVHAKGWCSAWAKKVG